MEPRFQEPGWFTKHVFNPLIALLTRLGLNVAGSRVLEVKGRKSGEWRKTPVNLLVFEDGRFWSRRAVIPSGCETCGPAAAAVWSSAGGSRSSPRPSSPDEEKPPLLRAYLKKWKWEVGQFFGGVGPDAPEDDLRRIAPDHPVFRIS